MSLELTWYGHAAVGVVTPMVKILIDPFITNNPKATVKPEDLEADVIAITHGHGAHLGDTIEIARRNNAMVISNFEIVTYLQKEGLTNTHALQVGGGHSFPWGRIKLTPALHGSAMPDGSYGGLAAGILLFLGGTRIYHAGDTGLFSDMRLIGLPSLDLALLPIGDNFTMGPEDALAAVRLLEPNLVIPMHYNTFELIEQDEGEWAGWVEQETDTQVQILNPGETLEL